MQKNRSKLVLAAVILFGASLLYRMYNEFVTVVMFAEAGDNAAYQVGRAVVPFAYYFFQAFVLWKALERRNWARIALAVVALVNIMLLLMVLLSSFGFSAAGIVLMIGQVVLEVIAVILLFISGTFLEEHAKVV